MFALIWIWLLVAFTGWNTYFAVDDHRPLNAASAIVTGLAVIILSLQTFQKEGPK